MPHLPDHQADHDPLLLAAYAAGDAEGEDLARARDLVATCDECAALHHDLRAIAAALPAVPAPARTRDFRLSPEQAASLRPAGWRRLLAPLAGPRFAFAAPLGGSLAALGLAGVLVAGAFSAPLAGTGGGAAREAGPQAAQGGAGATTDVQVGAPPELPVEAPASAAAALQPAASPAPSVADLSNPGAPAPSAPDAVAVPDAAASGGPAFRDPAFAASETGSVPGPKAVASPGSERLASGGSEAAQIAPVALPGTSAFLVLAVGALAAGLVLVLGRFVARRVA
jgi:hypothetical protein